MNERHRPYEENRAIDHLFLFIMIEEFMPIFRPVSFISSHKRINSIIRECYLLL